MLGNPVCAFAESFGKQGKKSSETSNYVLKIILIIFWKAHLHSINLVERHPTVESRVSRLSLQLERPFFQLLAHNH